MRHREKNGKMREKCEPGQGHCQPLLPRDPRTNAARFTPPNRRTRNFLRGILTASRGKDFLTLSLKEPQRKSRLTIHHLRKPAGGQVAATRLLPISFLESHSNLNAQLATYKRKTRTEGVRRNRSKKVVRKAVLHPQKREEYIHEARGGSLKT